MSDCHGKNVRRRRATDEWTYRFMVGGEEFKGPTNTMNKRIAEKLAEDRKDEEEKKLRDRRKLGIKAMTFGYACRVWVKEVAVRLDETGLFEVKDGEPVPGEQVRWLIKKVGDDKILSTIRKADITKVREERRRTMRPDHQDKSGKQHYRPVAPRTVNKTLRLLRRILRYAVFSHDAQMAPMSWKDHFIKVDDYPIKPITASQENRIAEHEKEAFRAPRLFGMASGLRLNEFIEIERDAIDWTDRSLTTTAKGRSQTRVVPLGDEEIAILKAECAKHNLDAVFTFVAERTKTVRYRNGREASYVKGMRYPMTAGYFSTHRQRVWHTKAGVKVRAHQMRHTAATNTLEKTGNLKAVQQMLGHADISTTAKFYTKLSDNAVRAAKDAGAAARQEEVGAGKNVGAKVGAKKRPKLKVVGGRG